MLWSSSSYGLPIDVRCTTEHICTSDRITRVGYFYMDLCLVHDIQLCYNKNEIRAALRAICDAVVFRTRCRSETDENPIRAAKRCFEPRGTRLPDARISKPHPRKGTETIILSLNQQNELDINFKTTSPQGDGNTFYMCPRKTTLFNYFKTTSPQGDGNNAVKRQLRTSSTIFQNHIPARGRKLHHCGLKGCNQRISKPHPRKGTETVRH